MNIQRDRLRGLSFVAAHESAIGPKRTSVVAAHTSAFGGKADMTVCGCLLSRSLSGVKRTWLFALHMSASDPKRTWPIAVQISAFAQGGTGKTDLDSFRRLWRGRSRHQ